MTSRTRGFDRFFIALLGLVLVAGGVLLIGWLLRLVDPGDEVETDPIITLSEEGWWPWALAALGLLLLLLGVRWLIAHAPPRHPTEARLPGSGNGGRFTAQLAPVFQTSSAALERDPFIGSVSASSHDHHDRIGVVVDVTMEPDARLEDIVGLVDGHLDQMHHVIGRSDFEYLARIDVDDLPQPGRRVW